MFFMLRFGRNITKAIETSSGNQSQITNVTAQQITLSTTTVHEVNKHILKMFNLLFRYETRNIIRVLNMIYTSVSKYPRLLEN